jgi:hypothetical protein
VALPRPRGIVRWTEHWQDPVARLRALRDALAVDGLRVHSGGPYARWDLHVAAGALGGVRVRTLVEEHGRGRQLARHRLTPRFARGLAAAVPALLAVAAGAAAVHAWVTAGAAAASATALVALAGAECGIAMAGALRALEGE